MHIVLHFMRQFFTWNIVF